MINRKRQVFIRSSRKEVDRTFLPAKSTFVVNAYGAFAFYVSEDIQDFLQQVESKLSTFDDSSFSNWNKISRLVHVSSYKTVARFVSIGILFSLP